jgi:putative ATP-binding cassette transporter
MSKPAAKSERSEKKSPFVEVTAEAGEHIEPPPPDVLEADPDFSPEEAEQARKDYLLTRSGSAPRDFGAKAATGWRGYFPSGS